MRNFFRLLRNSLSRPSRCRHRLLRRLRRQQRRFLSFRRSRAQSQGNEAKQREASAVVCVSDHMPEDCPLLLSPASPVDESFDIGDRMLPDPYTACPVPRPPTRRGFHGWGSFPGIPCQAEEVSEVASTTQPSTRISGSWPQTRNYDYLQPPPLPVPDLHFVANSDENDENESGPANRDYDYIQPSPLRLPRLPFAGEADEDEEEPTVSPLNEDASSVNRTPSSNPRFPLCMAFSWPLNPRVSVESIPIKTDTSEHPSSVTPPADLHHSDSAIVEDFMPSNLRRCTNTEATLAPFPSETISGHEHSLIPPIEPPSPQTTVPMPQGFSISAIVEGWRPLTPTIPRISVLVPPRRPSSGILKDWEASNPRNTTRPHFPAPLRPLPRNRRSSFKGSLPVVREAFAESSEEASDSFNDSKPSIRPVLPQPVSESSSPTSSTSTGSQSSHSTLNSSTGSTPPPSFPPPPPTVAAPSSVASRSPSTPSIEITETSVSPEPVGPSPRTPSSVYSTPEYTHLPNPTSFLGADTRTLLPSIFSDRGSDFPLGDAGTAPLPSSDSIAAVSEGSRSRYSSSSSRANSFTRLLSSYPDRPFDFPFGGALSTTAPPSPDSTEKSDGSSSEFVSADDGFSISVSSLSLSETYSGSPLAIDSPALLPPAQISSAMRTAPPFSPSPTRRSRSASASPKIMAQNTSPNRNIENTE